MYDTELQADLKLAQDKVENALISSRVAERAATAAATALERIEASLAIYRQQIRSTAPPLLPSDRLTYRIKEAAKTLGVSERNIFRMIVSGELETVKRGRARLIHAASLQRLIGDNA